MTDWLRFLEDLALKGSKVIYIKTSFYVCQVVNDLQASKQISETRNLTIVFTLAVKRQKAI
jgi:hypothetical protein